MRAVFREHGKRCLVSILLNNKPREGARQMWSEWSVLLGEKVLSDALALERIVRTCYKSYAFNLQKNVPQTAAIVKVMRAEKRYSIRV